MEWYKGRKHHPAWRQISVEICRTVAFSPAAVVTTYAAMTARKALTPRLLFRTPLIVIRPLTSWRPHGVLPETSRGKSVLSYSGDQSKQESA